MNIDELPEQLEAFTERARAKLDQDIAVARKTMKVLEAEKTAAQTELAKIQDEAKQARGQLDAVLDHLGKASNLASIQAETAAARKELQTVKTEITEASTKLAGLRAHCAEAEAKRVAVWNEVSHLRQEHAQHKAAINEVRTLFNQVQLGEGKLLEHRQ